MKCSTLALCVMSLSWLTACAGGTSGDASMADARDGDVAASDATLDSPMPVCGACPPFLVHCGDRCVDTTMSPNNCGACGIQCDTRTQVCQGATCVAAPMCTTVASPVPDGGMVPPHGLLGEYFENMDLTGLVVARYDANVDFDWGTMSPAPGVSATHYSVRWSGTVTAPASGTYTFHVTSDDGVRLSVDGQMVVDAWMDAASMEHTGTIALTAEASVPLRLEHYEDTNAAAVSLAWSSPAIAMTAVPTTALTPPASMPEYACGTGECCATTSGAPLCCPSGTACVIASTFMGCCPVGETCVAVPGCPDG